MGSAPKGCLLFFEQKLKLPIAKLMRHLIINLHYAFLEEFKCGSISDPYYRFESYLFELSYHCFSVLSFLQQRTDVWIHTIYGT